MVCLILIHFVFTFLCFLLTPWWVLVFILNIWHKQVASCKCICYLQEYVAVTLTFVSLVFFFSMQQDNVSYLSMMEIMHKDPIKRYKADLEAVIINWDSFDFNGKSVKVKVSKMFYVLFLLFVELFTHITWSF